MKGLTILQPYAYLIATGSKFIENRTWSTTYRGPLLIHAGKSQSMLMPEDVGDPRLVFGAIVAVAELVDCRRYADLPAAMRAHEHAHGPWCWVLDHVQPVEPMPYRGAQGLFDVDASVWPRLTCVGS